MTLATTIPLMEYVENGVTLVHAVPFQFESASQIVVSRIAAGVKTVLVQGVDYTVAGGGGGTGTVTKTNGGVAGTVLRIERYTSRAQTMDWTANDAFPAESHEDAADRTVAMVQELEVLARDIGRRALRLPPGEIAAEFPAALDRTNMLPFFGPAGEVTLLDPADVQGQPGGNPMAIGLFVLLGTVAIPAGYNLIHTSGYSSAGVGSAFYIYDAAIDAAYVAANPRTSGLDANGRGFKIHEPMVSPQMAGAPLSSAALSNAAFLAAVAQGHVYLPAGSRTSVGNGPPPDFAGIEGPVTIEGPGIMEAPWANAPCIWIGGLGIDVARIATCVKVDGIRIENGAAGTTDDNATIRVQQGRGSILTRISQKNVWTAYQMGYQPALDGIAGNTVPPLANASDTIVALTYTENARCMAFEHIRASYGITALNISHNFGVIDTNVVLPGGVSTHGLRWAGQNFTGEDIGHLAIGNSIRDRGGHGLSAQHWSKFGIAVGNLLENCLGGGIRASRASPNPAWAGYHNFGSTTIKDPGTTAVTLDWMTSNMLAGIMAVGSPLYGFVSSQAGEKAKQFLIGASYNSASSGVYWSSNRSIVFVLVADNAAANGVDFQGSNCLVIVLVTTEAASHVRITGNYNNIFFVSASDVLSNTGLTDTGIGNLINGAPSGKVLLGGSKTVARLTVPATTGASLTVSGSDIQVDGTYAGDVVVSGVDNRLNLIAFGNVSLTETALRNNMDGHYTGTLSLAVGAVNNHVPAKVDGAITNLGGASNTKPAAAVAL